MELDTPSRFELITESRKECEQMARTISEQVRKFTSSSYSSPIETTSVADDPENYSYTYIANAAARNLIADPRAHLAWGQDEVGETVLDLERGINSWYIDTNYRNLRERLLVDMALGFCVAAVSQEPRDGFEDYGDDAVQTPCLRRVPPSMFGWDIAANSFDECQFLFHTIIRKKAQLIESARKDEEDGWNVKAVEQMAENYGVAEARGKQTLRRNEVCYFELWDRSFELDDDDPAWRGIPKERREFYHGTLFTIAWGGGPEDGLGKALEIRRPRPYFGPRRGPYTLGGFLSVPNRVPPLSALIANKAQIDALNRQARANDRSAEAFKHNTIVDAPTGDGRASVISSNTGDILAIPGLTKDRIFEVSQGGVPPDAQAREEFLRGRADRNIGTSDELRGQANPATTATGATIAANAVGGINNLFDSKFAQFEANAALSVLYFMANDDRTVTRGGGRSVVSAKDEDGLARTVSQKFLSMGEAASMQVPQEESFHFDDLDVRVESMRLDGAEEQRFLQINALLLQWAPLLPSVSQYADLTPMWRRAADVYRFPELRRIFSQQAAQQVAQQMQEAAQAQDPREIPAAQLPSAGASSGGGGPSGGAKVSMNSRGKPHVTPGKTNNSTKNVMGGKK